MMLKIKFYFVFFLLSFSFNIHAQVYKAGTIFSGYVDIVPDTLLNYCTPSCSSGSEQYNIDVNGDLLNDFRMEAYSSNALGGGTDYIQITPLNTNSFVRFGRIDSVYHTFLLYWLLTPIAKPLQLSDSINSMIAKWDNTSLYLTNDSYLAGTKIKINDWVGGNDLYIGIKYETIADTIYGWIRVNCPLTASAPFKNKLYVKDYSFSKCMYPPSLTASSSSSVICVSESATLNAIGASSYTWSTGSSGSSVIVSPSVTTTYTVDGSNQLGCTKSAVITQSVDACVSIKEYKLNSTLIFPNPIATSFYLKNINSELIDISKIKIRDVYSKEINCTIELAGNNDLKIDFSDNTPEGCYILSVQLKDGSSFSKKLIKTEN